MRNKPYPRILHTPRDPGPYLNELISAQTYLGVDAQPLQNWSKSPTVSLILEPFRWGALRRRGVRIIHLHWVHSFERTWAKNSLIAKFILELWFNIWCLSLKASGLKLVWTAHNLLPHHQIFASDYRARRTLCRTADVVLAHNQKTLDDVVRLFSARRVLLISQGPTSLPAVDQSQVTALQARYPGRLVIGNLGRQVEYKGLDLLFESLTYIEELSRFVLLIGGSFESEDLKIMYEESLKHLERAGLGVIFLPRKLSDEEFALYLACIDIACLPFRAITNSGTIVAAATAEKPIVVPNFNVFADLSDDFSYKFEPNDAANLAEVIERAWAARASLPQMGRLAGDWAKSSSWLDAARSNNDAYELVLGQK